MPRRDTQVSPGERGGGLEKGGEPGWDRTTDNRIKSAMLYH